MVLGLSEQDDFANIPDLQNPGTQQNQNAQGDKRYALRRGPRQRQQREQRMRRRRCRLRRCWSWRTGPPSPGAPILGPFWIRPAPRHPCPGLEQAPPAPSAAWLSSAVHLIAVHPTRKCLFLGGWWPGGMSGRGASLCSLIPSASTSLGPKGGRRKRSLVRKPGRALGTQPCQQEVGQAGGLGQAETGPMGGAATVLYWPGPLPHFWSPGEGQDHGDPLQAWAADSPTQPLPATVGWVEQGTLKPTQSL